ncbi:predicted protein [Nematostella vectensis]|uniref:ABC transmembrane type-1 domain-containing protein n=1 Tax=Nematostella vectensis TaxID=45351 RepID=A7SP80_NEMVE|nr:predicted protein [Nematostella vectensis]|eukprot:XP_001626581.1 predicted protein [Nematostella vectensis]
MADESEKQGLIDIPVDDDDDDVIDDLIFQDFHKETVPQSTTTTSGTIGNAVPIESSFPPPPKAADDSDDDGDKVELLGSERKAPPFWTFEYYQAFFDVDTYQAFLDVDTYQVFTRHSLMLTLIRFIAFIIVLKLLDALGGTLLAVMLCFYLEPLQHGEQMSQRYAALFISGLAMASLVKVFAHHHFDYQTCLKGIRLKIAITGIIYKKVLVSSRSDLSRVTGGYVMNLISNDVRRVEKSIMYMLIFLKIFVDIVSSVAVLSVLVGWQSLIGIYQAFLDVDTYQVGHRILGSMVPAYKRNFLISHIRPNPDLYGPFWVCATLVFTTAIAGNLASYLVHTGDHEWVYDFHKVSVGDTCGVAEMDFCIDWNGIISVEALPRALNMANRLLESESGLEGINGN